jgi:hypothetical protein
MTSATRPFMTGFAALSATAIAIAPIAPPPPAAAPPMVHVAPQQLPPLELTASIADILTFPVLREYIINQLTDLATWGVGLAESGANLIQAIGQFPEALVQLTQQLLALDLQGALTTIEEGLVGTLAAVGLPILDSIITVRERNLAVQLALQTAVPEALIGFGAALFSAVDGVLRASIDGGQQVVDAVLTLDLGNIVTAFVEATQGFLESFVDGGQDIIDGIVFVQQTIATALATPPPVVTEELTVTQRSPSEFDDTATFATFSVDDDAEPEDVVEDEEDADEVEPELNDIEPELNDIEVEAEPAETESETEPDTAEASEPAPDQGDEQTQNRTETE